ncbi:MAG: hypothetical protein A2133_00370 [Actinobacteria bacterium RBG_16_64_13]|nr:MAG: hypothetical protein A2133_00370 [Actinobacteria bacterium RBG_16_64_13]
MDHVAESLNKSAVARAIIGLADSLDLNVVAEGIEHEEQRDSLVDLGCRLGQGFHFARPMDAERASAFLASAKTDSAVPLG